MDIFAERRREREEALQLVEMEVSEDEDENRREFSFEKLLEQKGEEGFKNITGFTSAEFLRLLEEITPLIPPRGRGRTEMSMKDSMVLFLAWATSGMTFSEIATHLNVPNTTVFRTITNFVSRTKDAFVAKFIPNTIEAAEATRNFTNFPHAFGAVDATVIPIFRPSDHDAQVEYFSGKHKIHCVKFQCLVNPDGLAVHLSKVVEGSMHDKKLFDESGLTQFLANSRVVGGHAVTERKHILCDAGYVGIQHTHPEAIIAKKKPMNAEMSDEHKEFNRLLSSDRMIVENYFGRMKVIFGSVHAKFRCKIQFLKNLVPILISVTNYHIQLHPLRRED